MPWLQHKPSIFARKPWQKLRYHRLGRRRLSRGLWGNIGRFFRSVDFAWTYCNQAWRRERPEQFQAGKEESHVTP